MGQTTTVYEIIHGLQEIEEVYLTGEEDALILTDCMHVQALLEQMGFEEQRAVPLWKELLTEASFCKVEAEQDYYHGTLVVPDHVELLGEPHRLLFFVNRRCVIFVGEDGFAQTICGRLQQKSIDAQARIGRILSLVLTELLAGDAVLLEKYEKELMHLEEETLCRQTGLFMTHMLHMRRRLLLLRSYYEQMLEVGRELEENENELFAKNERRYFGTCSARAERLLHRCLNLIDYAGQVKEVYQGQVDELQNRNMQFLTVVSTVFFPLTLITGWYGMNFEHMPELAHGYPYVAGISILVVIVCVWIFKKKKII